MKWNRALALVLASVSSTSSLSGCLFLVAGNEWEYTCEIPTLHTGQEAEHPEGTTFKIRVCEECSGCDDGVDHDDRGVAERKCDALDPNCSCALAPVELVGVCNRLDGGG